MDSSEKYRQTALSAAKQAGKILLHYFGKKESAVIKPNKSLVGKADLEANKAIIEIIRKNFPSHSILSEETGFDDRKSVYKWVIDPLDGTHNFLHGIDIFGTSIALEYKNEVVLGVLHFPVPNLTAVAEKGKGAYLNGKRINVSAKSTLEHSFILVDFSYAKRKEKIGFLENLIDKPIDFRNFGAAIHSLLLIAAGRCDGYVILTTNEWDIAAGFLLVEEAHGKVTNLQGKKWKPGDGSFIVSNGRLHRHLLSYVK